jgi:DNA-binding MarR family transcriptional regulator
MGPHAIARKATPDPAARAALDGIRKIVQVLRSSSRAAEQGVGVSGAQLFVLQRLAAEPALSVNELAERTLTHQSSVSVVVQRLAEKGLVARGTSAEDGRRATLSLTRRGRTLLGKAPGAAQDRLIAGLMSLRQAERQALARALGRLLETMGESRAKASMFFEEPPKRARPKGGRS